MNDITKLRNDLEAFQNEESDKPILVVALGASDGEVLNAVCGSSFNLGLLLTLFCLRTEGIEGVLRSALSMYDDLIGDEELTRKEAIDVINTALECEAKGVFDDKDKDKGPLQDYFDSL